MANFSTYKGFDRNKYRDFQRSKVYAAERKMKTWYNDAVISQLPTVEWNTFLIYVRDITMTSWWKSRFGRDYYHIVVRDGRAQRRATGGFGSIDMPRWSRSPIIICHELAHAVGNWGDKHGPEFCERFLWIVYNQLGEEAYLDLRSCFISSGVKFNDTVIGPPKTTKEIAYTFPVKPKRKANPAAIEALRKYREEKKAASQQLVETA